MDFTVTNSVLAGVVVLLGALWAWVLFNRLWREGLQEEGAGALARLETLGFTPVDHPLRARLEWSGQVGGQEARVLWRGGMLGARSQVQVGSERVGMEQLRSGADVDQALGRWLRAPEITPEPASS